MVGLRMCCGNQEMEPAVKKNKRTGGYIALLVFCTACSQNFSAKEPTEAMAENGFKPVVDSVVASPKQGVQDFGPFRGTAPDGWLVQKPSSSMRVAQYGLPGAAGEATLGVFYFGPGQGGGLEANVDRWYGQFAQPDGRDTRETAKRWNEKVGDIDVTMVDISGTFNGGMGNEDPEENYRMLGAIASHRTGAVFFKLIGPDETLAKWQQSFDQFLQTLSAREK